MYFPVGWPKILDLPWQDEGVNLLQISCDRTKILFVILTDNSISVWNKNPCIPIVLLRRDEKSLEKHGKNVLVEWKPDSSMLVVATTEGTLLIYTLEPLNSDHGVYNQVDSKFQNLRRDSAELFIKESIPSLGIQLTAEVPLYVPITCITCVSVPQMMVATKSTKILRIRWDGQEERDFTLDLQRIPFSINQQVSYAVPIVENKIHVTSMDYSPLIGGFAIVLSDGRAAYLTANTLKFDPNQVQGIWAQNVDDASCASINHKYRLLAFGRRNSQAVVYTIDDLTGGLELSHTLLLSAKDFPGSPGPVREMKWTPDGCAVVLSWANGGVSLWSTFGSTLMCSLGWDYGLNVDLVRNNPLNVISMDWAKEGYQLLMVRQQKLKRTDNDSGSTTTENVPEPEIKSSLVVLDFVKSSMTANPCMSSHPHLLLQGENKLYMNQGDSMRNIRYKSKMFATTNEDSEYADSFDSPLYSGCKQTNVFSTSYNICTSSYIKGEIKRVSEGEEEPIFHANDSELGKSLQVTSILAENKHWVVIQIPTAYMACNWPIRYSAIDKSGTNLAVAARLGFALYSVTNRKWKLFGNETQEKDFIVTGGLMWWEDFIIMGSYSILEESDELRMYPKEAKLDNRFARVVPMAAPVMLINLFKDQLVVFTNDGFVTSFAITRHDEQNVDLLKLNVYDIRSLFIHPACVVSVTMTNLKNETIPRVTQVQQSETLILNVSGRLLMVQREGNGNTTEALLTSTCLASCVECIWLSESHRNHLKESLWLFCGGHGMRVWLPVIPRDSNNGHRSHRHTFMSRRIMLSFSLRVYPLAILFEDAIILGVENDTVLYTSDLNSHFSLPFCVLERTSQVYLHQILRQLIRKNLGYNAWEIARSCTNLPYFPHSLELLLHEVLEEEATSKEPIPDALLPSVLEFIQEFPVYLQTVVQCARKTEIALWPYLFATAGKPKDLFQQCLASKQLETAASYLIILQNLEPSAISRQFATLLLDTALELHKWDLARDLVRFLRAIDPNDVESPRTSFVMGHQKLGLNQQPVSPNAEDLSLILGTMARGRSFSTTINPKSPDNVSSNQNAGPSQSASTSFNYDQQNPASSQSNSASRKKSVPQMQKEKGSATPEEFFIDVILQRHARRLLQERRFIELGMMSAALDFHLVGWLTREKDRAARVEDFVIALKQLHEDLDWPKPTLELKLELSKAQNLESHQDSPSYSLQSLKLETNIETVDSGYTSLPIVESGPANYDPKLSELVLKNLIANPKDAEKHEAEAKLEPHLRENNSISSEQMSSWADEEETAFQRQSETVSLDSSEIGVNLMPSEKSKRKKLVSHKLEVKMRYLLQIFTEANCLELSLLISVLLMDAASISRITNAAIRSSSLQLCRQLRNGLKDMTRWSFQECLGYRTFFINLQPQIYHLDNFVLQKEAIIPYVDTKFPLQDGVQFGNNSKVTPLRNSVPLERKGVVEPVPLLKRSDSIRSSAGIHGSPKHFEELRKSKTELNLSVKRKPPLESISQGCATPTNASSLNGPSSLAQDNSNCVLM